METSTLDLAYLESDPETGLASASVSLKASPSKVDAGTKAERLISAQCRTFIEFDAEIRRLHAELDEIRAKAKKKFYKAYAAGAALKTFPRSTLPSLFEFRSGNCS
jgi:hypothetical protein